MGYAQKAYFSIDRSILIGVRGEEGRCRIIKLFFSGKKKGKCKTAHLILEEEHE